MGMPETKLSVHDRVLAVIQGRKPDRIPFCDRLELWHAALIRQGRLPAEFEGLPLIDVHRKVGMGQLKFVDPFDFRLRGVELILSKDGEEVRRETDPVTSRWPIMWDLVPADRPGVMSFEFVTPVGKIRLKQVRTSQAVMWAEEPYLEEHPIKEPEDFHTVRWIYTHLEVVPRFDRVREAETDVSDFGFVVPRVGRIPFQEVLIDLLGEIETFYALNDQPERVQALLATIDERRLEMAGLFASCDIPYVEFVDNLTGQMTNPKLFAKYAIPAYQRYAEMYHAQGKRVGSHIDGDLKLLLGLLRETGLDVIESVSPAPLTQCTFDEMWEALHGRAPVLWGVIPSPLLEERVPEAELHTFVDHVLERVHAEPVILGVSDMVLGNNLIERVAWIARRIEQNVL